MTTLPGRPNTALVVIDVQNDVMDGTHDTEAVVANVAAVVDKARMAGVPVVWVQHSSERMPVDSPGWQLVPGLVVGAAEPVVHKRYADSFEETDLEAVLAGHGVGRLVVAGAQTDECIRSTLHGAVVRGYDATLVADAHTTEDLTEWGAPAPAEVIAHTNLYWKDHTAPGRTAGTVTTEAVAFG
jgi:nicotinamidase-related amidase